MAYGKIEKSIWNDAKFRQVSISAKLIFICLLTHPTMTQLGAMRSTAEGLRSELGLPTADFDTAMEQLRNQGMVRDDGAAAYIEVSNFQKHNPPANPNQVRSWIHVAQLLPECGLKTERLRQAIAHVKARGWPVPRELFAAAGLEGTAETRQTLFADSNTTYAPASHEDIESSAPPIGVPATNTRPTDISESEGDHAA